MIEYSQVLREFGFQLPAGQMPESLYAYAPVYRVADSRGEWIVKRAQRPLARALAVAAWTRALADAGVRVVTPAEGFGENPRMFGARDGGEDAWVVYPFVSGAPYKGSPAEISAAGELLGWIHATRPTEDFGLKQSETVVAIEPTEIDQDIERILDHVRAWAPGLEGEAREVLSQRRREYIERALPRLQRAHLPLANCVWDYKASNLIFPTAASPVLVDPDNGGRIPRAYDLAIAALLSHNEGQGPGRLFTANEWKRFVDGYARHVALTEEERQCWEDLLLCAWVDEALWLLSEDTLGWQDPDQSRMLGSLLTQDLIELRLSA